MEDERPIQPMKENEQNIDYISMDKLPVLSEDQLSQDNISLNLKKMIETPKWHSTFDAIVFFTKILFFEECFKERYVISYYK